VHSSKHLPEASAAAGFGCRSYPACERRAAPRLLTIAALYLLPSIFCVAQPAVTVQLGTATIPAGSSGNLTASFANTPTNISAFAFYVTNAPFLGLPTIANGPSAPNLTVFLDDFSNGVYRITGFVTNDPPIGSGIAVQLSYDVPASTAPGTYPVVMLQAPPTNGPAGPNPEIRALITSVLISSLGANGSILVQAAALGIGLRAYDGSNIIEIAVEPGMPTSPVRINKGGTTYGVLLVDPGATNASRIRIQTAPGVTKAWQKLP